MHSSLTQYKPQSSFPLPIPPFPHSSHIYPSTIFATSLSLSERRRSQRQQPNKIKQGTRQSKRPHIKAGKGIPAGGKESEIHLLPLLGVLQKHPANGHIIYVEGLVQTRPQTCHFSLSEPIWVPVRWFSEPCYSLSPMIPTIFCLLYLQGCWAPKGGPRCRPLIEILYNVLVVMSSQALINDGRSYLCEYI